MKRITDKMLEERTKHTPLKLVYAYGKVKVTYRGENLTGYGTRREAMNVIDAIDKYLRLETEELNREIYN